MANAHEIELYHNHLLAALNKERLLGQSAAVRASHGKDWKNSKFKGQIDFDLWPTEVPWNAESDQGRALAIFAFEKLMKIGDGELVEVGDQGKSGICWISWHERWERLVPDDVIPGKRAKQPHFMLSTIQWILFWGRVDEVQKAQIVRAEWDNAAHIAKEKGRAKPGDTSEAGQPHWHVDRVLELGDVDSFLENRGTELQEVAYGLYAGQYLKLQRVHLAMGGWKNAPAAGAGADAAQNHAARWQIEYTENRDELIE
jgi:hypothetical protein